MPEFNDIQKNLSRAIREKEKAKQNLTLKREQLLVLQKKKEKLGRKFDEQSSGLLRQKQILDRQEHELKASILRERNILEERSGLADSLLRDFQPLSDPREHISNFKDDTPFLLMPVRMETRFKELKDGNASYYQLWLRVYPDDCAIDSFEETLSRAEVASAKLYYQGMRQANEREPMERAAWRDLVSTYGSGRAGYILDNFKPIETGNEPQVSGDNQLILTIPVTEVPPEAEPIKTYWTEAWKASTEENRREAKEDLIAEVGQERASEIIENIVPSNFNSPPPENTSEVKVVFIIFPKEEELELKEQSWSQAARTNVLPDRFVVTAYNGSEQASENIAFQEIGNLIPSPLAMGPDPSLEKEEQLQQENGALKVNEELKWMVDFEEAVKKGMGFRISISEEQAKNGFDRIVVLGLKLSAGKEESTNRLESLFNNHQRSKKGLSILPQGTPTNNTETGEAAYAYFEDSDVSFDQRKAGNQFTETTDWKDKKDGQWLAEWLGLNPEIFKNTYNAGLPDQAEAKAMNICLFPATLGYMMESMMQEVFSEDDVEQTRWFFNHFVSGRGPIPAIKIGRQPYGILPTTAFSEIKWLEQRNFPRVQGIPWIKGNEFFLPKLYSILGQMDKDWSPLFRKAAYVGKEGDAHQLLLDIVGLSPTSVEFYQRYAESKDALINRFKLAGGLGVLIAIILAGNYEKSGKELLKKFGAETEETPDILKQFFLKKSNKLLRHLVDEAKSSETEPIKPTTTDDKNYLQWMREAATTSHDSLRRQEGFINDNPPSALLYLMLKHSLDLGYINTSLFLRLKAGLLSPSAYRNSKAEPKFIHIQENKKKDESRWKGLYEATPGITGNDRQSLGDYIPQVIETELKSSYLKKQLDSLKTLEKTPTARLERLLTEHIDLCTYRLDAWKNAFTNYELAAMRFEQGTENEVSAKPGIYLGSYGWLEDVRPKNKKLKPKNLEDEELAKHFNRNDEPQLKTDDQNGGFILAPSLNHAVTAAILRNAYMSDDNPETYEINLSSERVRKALSLVEGIRAGQSLSALLGYYMERELHDQNQSLEQIDFYIYKLRKAFPLRADKNKETQTEDSDPIEAIEARNVLDGLALINQIKDSKKKNYPFGKENILPIEGEEAPSEAIRDAIDKEVDNIINLNDAIADVAMAESVHQVVLGNYDRAAATMDAYSKGNFPPQPEVVQTPRSGTNITQRLGLQFETGLDPLDSPFTDIPMSARSKAEPAINKWLAGILPSIGEVGVKVSFYDHVSGSDKTEVITQKNLQLQPLDLIFLINQDDGQAMTAMDDTIETYVWEKYPLRPDTEIKIEYTSRITNKINFFELNALIQPLRTLIMQSRPLEAMDIVLSNEAQTSKNDSLFLDENRVVKAKIEVEKKVTDLETFIGATEFLLSDPETNRTQILKEIDKTIEDYIPLLRELAAYGLPQTGTGFIYERKKVLYAAIVQKIDELVQRWEEKLVEFNDLLVKHDNLPPTAPAEDRLRLLFSAERKIYSGTSTEMDPAAFRLELNNKNLTFENKLKDFKGIKDANYLLLSKLLEAMEAALPITQFDLEEFKITAQEDQVIFFLEEITSHAQSLKNDLVKRVNKAQAILNKAIPLSAGKKRVEMLQEAGRQFFGDDFKMLPEFEMPRENAAEWANSFNNRSKLLQHLENSEEISFPVDQWLYGLARVREKAKAWESLCMISEAFTNKSPDLHPVQLPFHAEDSWMALPFPEDQNLSEDKLLYTAHYATAFDKDKKQCGLLLDEWTELIPSKTEDVGATFHYDRPNSEPPQVMLLALPTEFTGSWKWEDLLNTVNDTLDQAKKRAVEPGDIDRTSYSRFLPATVSPVNVHPVSASLNYSFNNLVYMTLNSDNNE
ncbi:hypothetical protein SAMN05660776_0938 [Salegentibacter holothuriorum]|uniref:Uncharacterized protein n=1 Tax=Salegentibacter holothuriorum TaxID=241145 RepID=A0A1T5AXS2_9FLAO|nr:hypothetical protein [Salegentibacter holothuriorum]SKB39550.1 hypothetical protein SAMN05660776_0938 [Salegentibacter holothuriorum]